MAEGSDPLFVNWRTGQPEQVTTAGIADGAVTTPKLADDAVTTPKIADGAVTEPKIAASAVTESKIAASSVSTAKIQDNAVTNAKMATMPVWSLKANNTSATAVPQDVQASAIAVSTPASTDYVFGFKSTGELRNFLASNFISPWTSIFKTADQNVSGTTFTDDSELQFAMAANTTYVIRGEGFFDTNSTADFKFTFNGPTASSIRIDRYGLSPNDTSPSGVGTDEAYLVSVSITGTGTFGWFRFSAAIKNTSAGTFVVQWAQNTSSGTTTMLAGSYLEYRAVA